MQEVSTFYRIKKIAPHLTIKEITFGKLNKHLFRSKSVIELKLEVFNLGFCVCQLAKGSFELCCMIARSAMKMKKEIWLISP